MNKIDKYKTQDGCYNCEHVFILSEYDGGSEYFCHQDNSKRPLCGSVLMGEPHTMETNGRSLDRDVSHKNFEAWDNWSNDRRVIDAGICPNHIKEKVMD